MSKITAIHAVKCPGRFTSAKIKIGSDEDLIDLQDELVARVRDELGKRSVLFVESGVSGFYNSVTRKTTVLRGADDTIEPHEETHEILHRLWPNRDPIFDESLAYARGDYIAGGSDNIASRINLSLSLQRDFMEIANALQQMPSDQRQNYRIESLIGNSRIWFKDHNWAALVQVAKNFFHYATFAALFQTVGDDATALSELETSVQIIKRTGDVYDGLDYLARVSGQGVTNYRVDSQEISPPFLAPSNLMNLKGDRFSFQVWSTCSVVLAALAEVVNQKRDVLGELGDARLYYRPDFKQYLQTIRRQRSFLEKSA